MASNQPQQSATTASTASQRVVYVGAKPYGTEFLTSHTLEIKDLKILGDEEAKKSVEFNKGNDFSVPVSDLSPAVVEALSKMPEFKVSEG